MPRPAQAQETTIARRWAGIWRACAGKLREDERAAGVKADQILAWYMQIRDLNAEILIATGRIVDQFEAENRAIVCVLVDVIAERDEAREHAHYYRTSRERVEAGITATAEHGRASGCPCFICDVLADADHEPWCRYALPVAERVTWGARMMAAWQGAHNG